MNIFESNLLFSMQFISLILGVYIAFTKKVKRIFITDFVFNLSLLSCYLIIGDITTVAMYILATIRSFIYIYRDRFNKNIIPWVAIILNIVIGLVTIKTPTQILSIFIPCWVCYYLWYWNKDIQKVRFGNVINNGLWAIYNGIVGLWVVVLMRFIVVFMNVVSIYKNKD